MIKFPRKSRIFHKSYNKPYYGQPVRRKIPPWIILISIPLFILLLELLAQLFLGITGKRNQIPAQNPLFRSYQPEFLTEQAKTIDGLTHHGTLKVRRNSRQGYQLVGSQKNAFLQINPQGFREDDSLPRAKPKGEIRIFVLGGSTAFGAGASHNGTTLAHQLESRLQQRVRTQKQDSAKFRPDWFPFFPPTRQKLMQMPAKIREGNYRVINAAVPGYTSGNSLTQLAFDILPYQPDLVIVIGGYEDLMLPSQSLQAEIPHLDQLLADSSHHLQLTWGNRVGSWLGNTAIANIIFLLTGSTQLPINQTSLVLNTENTPLQSFLPKDEKELTQRRDRFLSNQNHMGQIAIKAGIPIIIALQPEISMISPEKSSPAEQKIRDQLGNAYLDQTRQNYKKFAEIGQKISKINPDQIKWLNFEDSTIKFTPPLFSDAVNLTNDGNTQIADILYKTVINWEKMQIIPENYHLKPNQP